MARSDFSARCSGLWVASLALLAAQGLARPADSMPPLAGLVETPPTTVATPPSIAETPLTDIKKPAGSWALYWHDEFCCLDPSQEMPGDRSEGGLDTKAWTLENWHQVNGNNEPGYLTDRAVNAYIHNDTAHERCVLALHAQREEYKGHHFTSARATTINHPVASQVEPPRDADGNYVIGGKVRVEAHIKLPAGSDNGTWPAFWLLSSKPDAHWPESGEIDIMEAIKEQEFVHSSVHFGGPGRPMREFWSFEHHCGNGKNCQDRYRTWALEWTIVSKTESTLKFFLDGKQQDRTYTQDDWWAGLESGERDSDPMAPFNAGMFVVLNLSVGEEACTYACMPQPGTEEGESYSQTMLVDWVRVWQSPASAVLEPYDTANVTETCPASAYSAAPALRPWWALLLSAVAALCALML